MVPVDCSYFVHLASMPMVEGGTRRSSSCAVLQQQGELVLTEAVEVDMMATRPSQVVRVALA